MIEASVNKDIKEEDALAVFYEVGIAYLQSICKISYLIASKDT